ncbi:MAG: aminopeptidase [Saprospiraceae bacterium]|nr:MAG: aminopeptidase [Saprospiraceae bacterium]
MHSKIFYSLFALLMIGLPFSKAQINSDLMHIKTDVVYLASDYLEGRETGKPGEMLAAEYIAFRYDQMGLKPKGKDGSWYQEFDFNYKDNPHIEKGEDRTGRNVVGFLDNGAKNTIVIGAHYDHLGHGIMGSLHAGEPDIHNGADDNASGVAAMLRLAKILAAGKAKNNNYLFIAFSGEELGLFGSKNFVNAPTIDLSTVNYMLNMDMVGRLNAEKVVAINGVGTSPLWKEILPKIKVADIQIKTTDSGIGPSDHTSFYLKDIPVLHFFTGQHSDYHKPADDAALVNFPGIIDVSDFMLAIIEKLDAKGKVAFSKTKDEDPDKKVARFKVTLGVMPDYVYQGEGMRIDGVLDGRVAAKAGIKNGDVVIKMGDVEVTDMYSYMEGLSKFKTGDKTIVVVKRGEEELEFPVEF